MKSRYIFNLLCKIYSFKIILISILISNLILYYDFKIRELGLIEFDIASLFRGYGTGYFVMIDFIRYIIQYLFPLFWVAYILSDIEDLNLYYFKIRLTKFSNISTNIINFSIVINIIFVSIFYITSLIYIFLFDNIIYFDIWYPIIFLLEMLFINTLFITFYIYSKNIIFSFIVMIILYFTNVLDVSNIFGFSSSIRASNIYTIFSVLITSIILMAFIYKKGRKVLWKN